MNIAELITELKSEALLAVSGANLPLGVEQRLRAVFDNAIQALEDTGYVSHGEAKAVIQDASVKEDEEDGA